MKESKADRLNREIAEAEVLAGFFKSPALVSWFEREEQRIIQLLCDRYQKATEAESVDNLVGQLHSLRNLRRTCEDAGAKAASKSRQRAEYK